MTMQLEAPSNLLPNCNGNGRYWPITPRPAQLVGINWLWENERGILSDAPGIGKTIQATYAAEPPCLVICPNYLTQQWYEWLIGKDDVSMAQSRKRIENMLPGYGMDTDDYVGQVTLNDIPIIPNVKGSVVLAVGSYYDKLKALQSEHDWCVINLESLTTHEAAYIALAKRNWWNTIIFDESHHLRNHASKRGMAAVKLAMTTPRVYELTATPIWKEVDDLFNQLRIIRPDIFKSYSQFLNVYCVTDSTRFGVKVLGVKKDMLADLEEILSILRLGRSYAEAGRELPSVINKVIKVDLPPNLRKIYDDTRENWIAKIESYFTPDGTGLVVFDNLPQVIQSLRLQARWPGKYEAAAEVIADTIHIKNLGQATHVKQLLDSRKKTRVVVFGWFQDTVTEATKYFNKNVEGCNAVAITGAITNVAERRRKALDRNNNVVVATIASLSEGIDLSDAHTVIFLEEHYTPGSNYQALSRVNRERVLEPSDEPTLVYYIHSRDTIDESIHKVVQGRSGTIKEVLRSELGLGL